MKAGPHRKGIEDGAVCMDFDVHILTRYETRSKAFNFFFWGGGAQCPHLWASPVAQQ